MLANLNFGSGAWLCLSIGFSLIFICGGDGLHGQNRCSQVESYTATIRVSKLVPYEVKTYVWCVNVPPRCSKIKIQYNVGFEEKVKDQGKLFEVMLMLGEKNTIVK